MTNLTTTHLGLHPRAAALYARTEMFHPRVVDVAPGVRQAIGVGIANVTVFDAPEGPVVLDTGSTSEEGLRQRELLFGDAPSPVGALIYSHNHYAKGATAYTSDQPQLEIWGHEKVHANFMGGRSAVLPTYVRRIGTQMGRFLPVDGPDAPPNCGIGASYDLAPSRYGYVRPTRTIASPSDVTIAGRPFTLLPAFSDTDCTITVWDPEQRVAVTNIMWGVFPNIGAIRGEYFRDPLRWIQSLDDVIELRPAILLGVHGLPIIGEAEALTALTQYRDAIQFVYDQTVRGINDGLGPSEIVDRTELPAALAGSAVLGQFYGELPFAIRGVYAGLMGWYGNDPADLKPIPRDLASARYVELMGGRDAVRSIADAALNDGDAAWAAELAGHLVRTNTDDRSDAGLKARALRALALDTSSAITRNFYLTYARELEGELDVMTATRDMLGVEKYISLGLSGVLEALRYRVRADAADTDGLALVVDNALVFVRVRNGVLVAHDASESTEPQIRVTLRDLAAAVADPRGFPAAADVIRTHGATPAPFVDFLSRLQ